MKILKRTASVLLVAGFSAGAAWSQMAVDWNGDPMNALAGGFAADAAGIPTPSSRPISAARQRAPATLREAASRPGSRLATTGNGWAYVSVGSALYYTNGANGLALAGLVPDGAPIDLLACTGNGWAYAVAGSTVFYSNGPTFQSAGETPDGEKISLLATTGNGWAYVAAGASLYYTDGRGLILAGRTPDGAPIERLSATGGGWAYIVSGANIYDTNGANGLILVGQVPDGASM